MDTLSWFYLPTAFLLGMAHALEPGHSKTLVASYLIGIKGKARDAVLLGITVTITHTIVIFLLALAALAFGTAFPMEKVQYWLEVVSAALVFGMGLWLLRSRWQEWKQAQEIEYTPVHEDEHTHVHIHEDGHAHTHDDHDHHHGHSHALPAGERLSFRQLVSFGFSGGLVPCPAALAILILAVGLGKPVLGLVTVTIFSVGLALALIAVGVAVCHGVAFVGKRAGQSKWLKRLPIISSAIVTALGLAMLIRALMGHTHTASSPQTR
jgi:nickel/cobalt exporter